jgi:hypothetical protein
MRIINMEDVESFFEALANGAELTHGDALALAKFKEGALGMERLPCQPD